MTQHARPSGVLAVACLGLLAGASPLAAQGSVAPPHLVLDLPAARARALSGHR